MRIIPRSVWLIIPLLHYKIPSSGMCNEQRGANDVTFIGTGFCSRNNIITFSKTSNVVKKCTLSFDTPNFRAVF